MPNGEPLYANPGMITFFASNSEATAEALQRVPGSTNGKGALIFIAGVCIQVQETPNMIINSITRLRQKAEENALNLKKKADKESWEDDEDDFDE